VDESALEIYLLYNVYLEFILYRYVCKAV